MGKGKGGRKEEEGEGGRAHRGEGGRMGIRDVLEGVSSGRGAPVDAGGVTWGEGLVVCRGGRWGCKVEFSQSSWERLARGMRGEEKGRLRLVLSATRTLRARGREEAEER